MLKILEQYASYRRKMRYLKRKGWYGCLGGIYCDKHGRNNMTRHDIWNTPEWAIKHKY